MNTDHSFQRDALPGKTALQKVSPFWRTLEMEGIGRRGKLHQYPSNIFLGPLLCSESQPSVGQSPHFCEQNWGLFGLAAPRLSSDLLQCFDPGGADCPWLLAGGVVTGFRSA